MKLRTTGRVKVNRISWVENQKGVVSMLTAVFFSILILIVTLGTLLVQTRELRQSTDVDQSVVAFSAAQAGLEKALLELKANPNLRQSCQENSDARPVFDNPEVEITCVEIANSSSVGTGTMVQERAHHYDWSGARLEKVVLQWHNGDPTYTSNPEYAQTSLPNRARWTAPALPAVIEAVVYSYPDGIINYSQIRAKTFLIRPTAGSGVTTINYSTSATGSFHTVGCNTANANGYRCEVWIDRLPTDNVVVRMRSRYADAPYVALFYPLACPNPSECQPEKMPNSGVSVDVTARAGDVFRRVTAVTNPGVPFEQGLIDYVILSNTNICKNLTIRSNRTTAGNLGNC